jgi:hypothetical protein
LTNTSTLESTWGGVHPKLVDMAEPTNHFFHEQVSTMNANYNGIRLFDDWGLVDLRLRIPNWFWNV